MNLIDRAVAAFSPTTALQRVTARRRLEVLASYDAAGSGARSAGIRRMATDADAASRARARIAFAARDLIRNTPLAVRAQMVIANSVVGDGILPKITFPNLEGNQRKRIEAAALGFVEACLDTTLIDGAGRNNLYGLQRLVMQAVAADGECLVVQEWDRAGSPARQDRLPLRLRVLEIDHLDTAREGMAEGDNYIHQGIEYDQAGRRVAYWLFDQHPGADGFRGIGWRSQSSRVPADLVHHVYRVDRPGQERGVSWFAPVVMALQDFADYQDAQIVRQKIAAMFAAFRIFPDPPTGVDVQARAAEMQELRPGAVIDLYNGEQVQFGEPPGVDGFDEFTRVTLRAVAGGLGITYEALTGDLTGVNWASYRVGFQTMERNVSSWQWTMLIPQMMQPLGRALLSAWMIRDGVDPTLLRGARVDWTPPARFIVDPSREVATMKELVRAGFASRQQMIRSLGQDPERVVEEQIEDKAEARRAGLVFDTDPELVSGAGQTQQVPIRDKTGEEETDE